MTGIIIVALSILAFIVIYQISIANDAVADLREDKAAAEERNNKIMAWLMMITFIVGLIGIWLCDRYLRPLMLPVSASKEGVEIDFMSDYTLVILAVAFFITHVLLFYFIFRYRGRKNRKARYYPHNNKLEIAWTTIPGIVLLLLIVLGLKQWFKITGPAPKDSMVVQIVGKQFNWLIRYPGPDGVLGKTDFRLINDANNVLGLDWNDPASRDDIIVQNGEMHLVKGKPVHLVINSRDVIHDVGLPYFRMKMDAVPGITTTLWFTPSITTKEMIKKTNDPDFVYEIACDQLCGRGHYSMRGTIIVQTKQGFKKWINQQKPYYVITHSSENKQNVDSTASDSTAANKLAMIKN